MEKISITIITHNEEKNIERCLASLKWADEIVVLDSFSTDRTVEICRRYTPHVYQERWHGYGRQKNICAAKTSYRWVLNLDADEAISAECADAIRAELKNGPVHAVYCFPRKNYFGGRWVRYAGWYPDHIARLYDKARVSFTEPLVHEKLSPDKDMGVFQQPLWHYSYLGMEDYIARQNRYSTLYARDRLAKGRGRVSFIDICLRPPLAFLKSYILQQGFREGSLGFFLAVSTAFYTFLKYTKIRHPDVPHS